MCVLTTPDDGELPDEPRGAMSAQAEVEAAHAVEREAHDAKLDAEEAAPKKRRKKSTSPTARTLAECKKRGWIAGVVERHIPFPKPMGTKIDLFGVIDLVVIVPTNDELLGNAAILGIQATASAAHHAHRRTKILAEPRAKAWVDAGGRLELWSWSKRGDRGKAKRWTLRVETYEEMRAAADGEEARSA